MKNALKTKEITALVVLSEMDKMYRELKSPSMPANYVVSEKFDDRSANGLTKAIINFIRLSGGQAERINNMGRMRDNTKIVSNVLGHQYKIGSIEWQKGSGTKGTADISAVINGLSVKIEVKIGKDKQSDDQKKYEQNITDAGGIYFIATEFRNFVKWYVAKFGKSDLLIKAIHRLKN